MKILFIGNSYTYYNDMPALLESLLRENGYDATVHSVTKGGRKLYKNLIEGDEYNEKIVGLVRENCFDILFLQEQSYLAIVDAECFENAVGGLKALVNAGRTVLYATWGRKSGCPLLSELSLSSDEMTDALCTAYQNAARAFDSEVSPVGLAFKSLSGKLELYCDDMSHPSYVGSAVAAIVHYRTITGKLPKKSDSLGLDKETVDTIIRKI
jgi:hypothetical protein